MVRKFCVQCKEYSYSAASGREWICPICGNDLTSEQILNIREKSNKDYLGESRKD